MYSSSWYSLVFDVVVAVPLIETVIDAAVGKQTQKGAAAEIGGSARTFV